MGLLRNRTVSLLWWGVEPVTGWSLREYSHVALCKDVCNVSLIQLLDNSTYVQVQHSCLSTLHLMFIFHTRSELLDLVRPSRTTLLCEPILHHVLRVYQGLDIRVVVKKVVYHDYV